MEQFFKIIAILTAGISLAMGIFSLLNYFNKGREKVNLAFSILCLLVVVFILVPPVGFILTDDAPYSANIKVKRIFNLSFIAFFPWFISLYTGFSKKVIQRTVIVSIVISYLSMFFTTSDTSQRFWVLVAVMSLAIIVTYSIYAAYKQFMHGEKAKATILFIAIGFFSFFNFLGSVNYFDNNSFINQWDALFLPMNLCPLAFISIMGIQLHMNSNKDRPLEKKLGLRESRWQSLLKDIQFIIVNTDIEEKIIYVNPYGVNLLKYQDASELLNTSWSDHSLPAKQAGRSKSFVVNGSKEIETVTLNRSTVLTKDGKEKIINWSTEVLYNDEGEMTGKLHIGSDITEQEEAIQQVHELKAELEKENLVQRESSLPLGMHPDTIGKSGPFMYAIQKSKQVAPTNASVLLLGETGVGKESFADLIQRTSMRSNKPFVKVNCGALPAELIEDELFGHEKGAFTGAISSRMGRFEKADGGTIFLDEIGELPLVLQPKLLRVLQNGEFERVGGHQTIKVDVRIIAATNNDLEKEVRDGRFRDDLFYRLNVFPITIPPLRKRNGDIVLLIQNFIERKSKEHGKKFENISKADMNRLCDYEWPGNIRELKNVIERAVISSENQTLKLDWFYEDIEKSKTASTSSLEEMETAYIIKVLQECNWKINGENGAAEKLVMHPNTLRSRMKKLKINVPWKQEA